VRWGVKLVVSDDHGGLKAARQAVLTGVPWQRCQFHLMQNAMAQVPKIGMRAEVAGDLRRVFDADEPAEAERRLRTTNCLERLNKEIKRRTRLATLVPERGLSPEACLRRPLKDQ
jgi:transposase-like protein